MKIYTLENIERLKDNENLYDIFYPMLVDNPNLILKEYVVREEREMRIDLICMDLYGNTSYIDELLHINGITDPYSMKTDDIIYYADNINLLRKDYEGNLSELELESNQKNIYGKNLTTSRPDGFKSILVDTNKKEIKISTKLK